MDRELKIDGRPIGPDHPPYVVCEISANHRGSLPRMLETLEAAARTGCDAIKIQSYTPDTMTIDSTRPEYRIEGGLWDGRTLYDLYGEAQTPFEWHAPIFAKARELGVTLFSTPFDSSALALLKDLDAPAYKIASFELVDLPLIAEVARAGKPMIMSTGLANLAEIEAAVRTAREAGGGALVLLHCVSAYPAPSEASNLRTIPHLAAAFDVVAGLSDHTHGTAVAAVALGAAVIEKHFTLARADGGPDAAFSLEPDEFARLTADCKTAWRALGGVTYRHQAAEAGNVAFRRSLCAVEDITAGDIFSPENVRSIRPGFGLPPSHLPDVLGRLPGGARLAEAIRYALRHWDGLVRYLDDGRLEIDTNTVERAIRPITLNRKNALFAGSDQGAEHWAVVASLIETCKLNGIDPHAYLTDTLERLVAGHPQSRIDDLMPWAHATAHV